jgi:hypothetical protein
MTISRGRGSHGAWSLLGLAAAALALAGCGGSGSSASNTPSPSGCSDCGTLLVGLTDADGDFVSYTVDVLSITLRRANGVQVETLPQTTRVDFAQLTNLSDLFSVTTLAPGDFAKGTIRLDYTNADIEVQKGTDTVKATPVDANGNPLGVTELEIRFDGRDHLIITKRRATFLAVDFNLAASNVVDTTKTPPVVTVNTFITASVQPVEEKDLRVRGPLVSVDTTASSYVVDVRPWHLASGNHGQITVHTTGTTSFEIDGTTSTGASGLQALAAKPAGTLTVAFGTLDTTTRDFTANTVRAGTSVDGEGLDAVQGNVVSRNGDSFTIKGAFAVHRDDDHFDFPRTVIVTVGDGTKVIKAGSTAALDTKAISVGQRVVAFGKLTEPAANPVTPMTPMTPMIPMNSLTPPGSTADTTSPLPGAPAALDATSGRVRLEATEIRGAVKTVASGTLTMQLRAIDRLGIDMFDFTGTGSDPTNYQVSTRSLSLASLTAGDLAQVIGFVTPFGSAPPDFAGQTVIGPRELPAVLGIGWGSSGTTAPFLSMNSTGLVIDNKNPSIGDRHFILYQMSKIDILTLASGPTIAPTTGRGIYGIWEPGHSEVFENFADFQTKLATRLGAGDAVNSLTAFGAYDSGANTLTANGVFVLFGKVDASQDDD